MESRKTEDERRKPSKKPRKIKVNENKHAKSILQKVVTIFRCLPWHGGLPLL